MSNASRAIGPFRWKRPKNRVVIFLVGLAMVGVLAVFTLRLAAILKPAINEALLARSELINGAELLKTPEITPGQAEQALANFRSAESHFSHVHAVLTESHTIGAIQHLPIIDRQVEAALQLSDIGINISRSGQELVRLVTLALASNSGAQSPTERVLGTLQIARPRLEILAQELGVALQDREKIPTWGLIPPIASVVSQLDARVNLPSMRDAVVAISRDSPAVGELLGVSSAKSYLVLQQDVAELRATGGFIGSVGFLTFDRGRMGPFIPKDIDAIDTTPDGRFILGPAGASNHVDPPPPLQEAFHLQSWELRDANWSPDFPTTAQEAEFLLQRERGIRVDGVIAIDPYFIQRLLAITGPVKIPETGDTIDAQNFFSLTLTRVELSKSDRKRFLSDSAREIIAKLLQLSPAKWFTVLQSLQSACDTRSVQAYFNNAQIEGFVDHHQCGGEVRPAGGDSLLIIDSNLGGDKDDFWLKRRHSLKIAIGPDGSALHTLRLHYFGLIPQRVELTEYNGYTGWLRVYIPPSSVVESVSGASLNAASELGCRVLQGWVHVPFYKTLDITITYKVGSAALKDADHRLSFFWRKQAGRPGDPIHVEVTRPHSGRVTAVDEPGSRASNGDISSDLTIDRQFIFTFGP